MTYPSRLPDPELDGNPPDVFDQGAFEDEAWSNPGVVGIVVAIAIVLVVAAVGLWFDFHPNFSVGVVR